MGPTDDCLRQFAPPTANVEMPRSNLSPAGMHVPIRPLVRSLPLVALALVACGNGDPADTDATTTTAAETTAGATVGAVTDAPTTRPPGTTAAVDPTTTTTTGTTTTTTGDDPDTATGTTGREAGFDENLPYGGRFHGVAASGRGPGNTRFATMAAHRLRAEKSGYVTAVR
ncbi:hypothetical protein SAMN02745121_05992 [Nannocystis exedens]|uniref:Uncharacterized protein n=1 Tax=Nannocystis exedens TaxID=54 RepID=A0A1I2EB50_9BACT|nr:hypothetical protein NAEX_07929 [Nannocystis exedens]SFE90162.1 hypothetical protein SAMN02745121_05992 [Nannocystis exedens]